MISFFHKIFSLLFSIHIMDIKKLIGLRLQVACVGHLRPVLP